MSMSMSMSMPTKSHPKGSSESYPASTVVAEPTISPSPVILHRTLQPTLSPAPIGSRDGEGSDPPFFCESVSGSFGDLEGQPLLVQFGYELETLPQSDLSVSILPDLENSLTEYLLAALFPEQCGDPANGPPVATQIEGITSAPDDEPLNAPACLSQREDSNQCSVVSGWLTVFASESFRRRRDSGEGFVKEQLQVGMTLGAFDNANPSIQRVSYVDLEGLDLDEPSIRTENEDRDGLLVGLLVAGGGTFVILIGALVYRRRRLSKDIDNVKDVNSHGEHDQGETLLTERANGHFLDPNSQTMRQSYSLETTFSDQHGEA